MSNTEEVVAAYMAAWNEADEGKRRRLLERAWADDGAYTDPQSDVAGREALVALIGGMHSQMAGARIDVTSKTDFTTTSCVPLSSHSKNRLAAQDDKCLRPAALRGGGTARRRASLR